MFDFSFNQLSEILGIDPHNKSKSDRRFVRVFTDSRLLESSSQALFIAIQGQNFDGHNFLIEAYKKGIRQFIVEKHCDLPSDCDSIQVASSIAALQKLATFHRSQFDIPIIGITGSNGKTIVKEWLNTILSVRFKVVKSPQSYNSQLGVPLSLLELSEGAEVGIFEAGISEKGEMEKLQQMIQPNLGIFTNLGEAHDAGFQSREEKAREKSKLFDQAQAIEYQADAPYIGEAVSELTKKKLIKWSVSNHPNANIHFQLFEKKCHFHFEGKKFAISLPFSDHPDTENLLHCISIALHMGLSQEEIQSGLNQIRHLSMRLSLKEGINNCYILDDTYNNDLGGLKAALSILRQQDFNKQKTVILTDLSQTGLESDQLYQTVNTLLEDHGVSRLTAVGKDLPRGIL